MVLSQNKSLELTNKILKKCLKYIGNLMEFEEVQDILSSFKKKEFPDIIINGQKGHLLKKVEEKDKLKDLEDRYKDIV